MYGDKMKKAIFLIICFWSCISLTSAIEINSQNAVLYNLNENKIIFEQNSMKKTSIASLTKIMTTLVAIENINDFNEKVTLTSSMFEGLEEAGAYTIGLQDKQIVTYNDLLYAMFLASGADATRAISILIAGNENNFVNLMNKKAQDLKLENTHFSNTVGLDDINQYSTVNEVAIILKEALKNQKFKEIFNTSKYTLTDDSITVENSMKKTAHIYGLNTSYILGAKTGFTNQAGRCLASLAYDNKNNITYLLVTTNASKMPNHINDAIEIYNYYFNNFKYHTILKKHENIIKIPVKYSTLKDIEFKTDKEIKEYLKNDYNNKNVSIKYSGIKTLTPKNKKGQKIGIVTIKYKNKEIKKLDIILNQNISFSIIGFIIYYKYYIFVILSILIIFIILFSINRKKSN